MNNYMLNDLLDHLFYKSGNKVVDDFIKHTQVSSDRMIDMKEFVPYDQFKNIEFNTKVNNSYKAIWIDGNIQSWNKKNTNFKRSGSMKVILKELNDSEDITSMMLDKVCISIIIYSNCE